MTRVVLATMGSLGDLYPFLAIAIELRQRGLHPILAGAEEYRPFASAEGIDFHPVRPGAAEYAALGIDEAAAVRAVIDDVTAPFDLILPHLQDSFADLQAIVNDAELVIASTFSIAARIAAEAAGVQLATVVLQPSAFCSADDPPVIREAPFLRPLRRAFGAAPVRLLYALGRRRFRSRSRPIDELRSRLGLPAVRDELIEGPLRAEKVFALYPPAFAALARDAPAHAQSAGFSFYDGARGDTAGLSPELAEFLAHGPPPLVFTLGSLAVFAPGDFYAASAHAARRLGHRAVLLVGDHAVDDLAHLGSDEIAIAGYASHARLFARAAAVIHHGGIGTTAKALRAGVPQLVCPVLGDQFDNADRLRRLGVAAILPLRRYTPDRAAHALRGLLADHDVAVRARNLGSQASVIDGPAVVADWAARALAA